MFYLSAMRSIALGLFVLLHFTTAAQENANTRLAVDIDAMGGVILRHSSKFIADVGGYTQQYEAGIRIRTFGQAAWQRKARYPEMGIALHHAQFADHAVFGDAWALLPHIRFTFARTHRVDVWLRTGAGLAWITRPYDRRTNPTNNIIGSKLNAIIQIRPGLSIHLTDRIDLVTAFSFTHYSNSRSQSPNLGINVAAATVGLSVDAGRAEHTANTDPVPPPAKRNEYIVRFSMAVNDQQPGGPKTPVYLTTLGYARFTSVINKVMVGTTVAYDQGERDFLEYTVPEQLDDAGRRALDWSIFVADEIMLGDLGLNFLVGVYLMDRTLNVEPIYAKVGANYYLPAFGQADDRRFFVGVNLKSHYSVAQFLEFGVGMAL